MANEASELLDGLPADNIGNDSQTNEDNFSDEALGLESDDQTGQHYDSEEYQQDILDKPISDNSPNLLKTKGLDRYKDIPAALDGLVELNSQMGSLGSKLEGYGQLQERNKILEEQLEKLFVQDENGELAFSDVAIKQYVRQKEITDPELTHEEIMEDLDADFSGTLDRLIEQKVGGKLKSLDAYIERQKRQEEDYAEQEEQEQYADDLFNHYMENEEGFKENIEQIDMILESNSELYNLDDPLKIAMQMLKRAENIAAKKRADGTFVESSRTQTTEQKSDEDKLWEGILSQQSNAANLLAG